MTISLPIFPIFCKNFGSFSIINNKRGKLKYRDYPLCNMLQHSSSCCLPLSPELIKLHKFNKEFMTDSHKWRVYSASINFSVFLRTPESQNANKHIKRRWRRVGFSEYPSSQSKRVRLMGSVQNTGKDLKWDISPFLQILQAFSPKTTGSSLLCLLLGSQFRQTVSSFVRL